MGSLLGSAIRMFRSPVRRYADSVLHRRAAKQVLGTHKDVLSRVSRDYPILESAIVHLMIDAVEFSQLMVIFHKTGAAQKLFKEAADVNPEQCDYIRTLAARTYINDYLRGSLLAIQKDGRQSCEKMDAAADLIRTIPLDTLQRKYFSELAGYASDIAQKTYVIPTRIQPRNRSEYVLYGDTDDVTCIGSIFMAKANTYRNIAASLSVG